jgi:3-hydroxyisobutyrate dehydrogenase
MAEKIGIVGVGRMGANMARRLKECGYNVTVVYDINRAASQALAKEIGAEACVSLQSRHLAGNVIITVVTDDKAMLKIFAGNGDSLLARAAGKTFINCATISPEGPRPG